MENTQIIQNQRTLMPFISVILKYEDCNEAYPLENDYFRLDRGDISDVTRIEKIIGYLDTLKGVLENAKTRLNNDVDILKYISIREEIKKQAEFLALNQQIKITGR